MKTQFIAAIKKFLAEGTEFIFKIACMYIYMYIRMYVGI